MLFFDILYMCKVCLRILLNRDKQTRLEKIHQLININLHLDAVIDNKDSLGDILLGSNMEHERNGAIFREKASSNIEEHPKTVDYSAMMALEHTIDLIKIEIEIPASKWYKKEKIVVKTKNGGKLFEKRFKGPAAEICGPAGGRLWRFVILEIERNDFFQVQYSVSVKNNNKKIIIIIYRLLVTFIQVLKYVHVKSDQNNRKISQKLAPEILITVQRAFI